MKMDTQDLAGRHLNSYNDSPKKKKNCSFIFLNVTILYKLQPKLLLASLEQPLLFNTSNTTLLYVLRTIDILETNVTNFSRCLDMNCVISEKSSSN